MWIYIGPGWIPGVPARDLTDAEMKYHGVEDSGIYIKAAPKGAAPDEEVSKA